MNRTVTREEFDALVMGVEHSAFRLEIRDHYQETSETSHLTHYLAGDPDPDYAWYRPWEDFIASRHTTGVRFTRLRVVTWPPSDYTLFGMSLAARAVAAGERILYLDRAHASDLPTGDFWLLDNTHVLTLRFGADGHLHGGDLTDDEQSRTTAHVTRDVAASRGLPGPAFLRSHLV